MVLVNLTVLCAIMTTKQRTSASSARVTKPSKKNPKPDMGNNGNYLGRIHSLVKKTPMRIWIMCILATGLIIADQIYGVTAGGVSLGMLYILADNGRKSGRASGNVYMKNGVIRGYADPANPQTVAQMTQRASFGFLSSNWNSLSEDEQNAWNAFRITVSNRFGNPVTVSGKGAYIALNRNLFNIGDAYLTTPPLPVGIAPPTTLSNTCDASAEHLKINFTPTPVPAGVAWLVFATQSLSSGVRKPSKSAYRLITALPATTASGVDLTTEYDAVFGGVTVGARVFVKVIAIGTGNGFSSTPLTSSALVTA